MRKVDVLVCVIALSTFLITTVETGTTCTEPQPPKHGTVKLHGDLNVGSIAVYSCDPGRRLVGAAITKCQNSGNWTFDAPECLSSCKVPFIENGEMGSYETRYARFRNYEEFEKVLDGENVDSGETLTLRCRRGSLPVENSEFLENNRLEVICDDGTWSKDMQCKQTQCSGPPPPSKNARPVISNRAHGHTIFYTCTNMNHEKINGNVTCHLGSWIGVPSRCLIQPCYIKDLNYPGLIKPAEEIFDSFESFQINCETGYGKRPGLQTITCARGRWDISQSPCIQGNTFISFDEDLKILPDGIVSVQKHEKRLFVCSSTWKQPEWDYGQREKVLEISTKVLGSECTQFFSFLYILELENDHSGRYECFMRDDLDRRIGSTFLYLKVNGKVSCSRFTELPELRVNYSLNASVGSIATFSCSSPTRNLVGSSVSICQENGTWSNPSPSCEELDIRCLPINRSEIFTLNYSSDRRVNSTVTFFCKANDKRIEGSSVLICLPNGTWSGSDPKCVDHESCPQFPNSPGLQVTYSNDVSVGSIATFKCSESIRYLNGSNFSECLRNGSWSNPLPSCEGIVGCLLNLDPSSHLIIQPMKDNYRVGEFAYPSCPPGEEMSRKVERLMCLPGEWSDTIPECIESRKKG